ncbi:UNVERIFIED_CONTAM: hypothetical protein FKN15_052719 [Acipenser sinensis]
MFREVEELMKDTQHKLEEAVHQIDNESVQDVIDFPPDYHNESSTDSKAGNTSFHSVEKIDKVTDNETGATFFSKTVITSSSSEGGEIKHYMNNKALKRPGSGFDFIICGAIAEFVGSPAESSFLFEGF